VIQDIKFASLAADIKIIKINRKISSRQSSSVKDVKEEDKIIRDRKSDDKVDENMLSIQPEQPSEEQDDVLTPQHLSASSIESPKSEHENSPHKQDEQSQNQVQMETGNDEAQVTYKETKNNAVIEDVADMDLLHPHNNTTGEMHQEYIREHQED
jgi:hypothetical protein